MRPIPCLVLALVLAGCGSPQQTQPAPGRVEATIAADDGLLAEDLGATVVGATIAYPALHELQIATLVFRDGAFSAGDSFVACHLSNQDRTQRSRIIAFAPKGPLRPEATDTLIRVGGRELRGVLDPFGISTYGHAATSLMPGDGYRPIGHLVFGGAEHGISSDIHAGNVVFGVHLYARLAPLAPDDPRLQQLRGVSHAHVTSRTLKITALDEIVPPDPARKPAGAANF